MGELDAFQTASCTPPARAPFLHVRKSRHGRPKENPPGAAKSSEGMWTRFNEKLVAGVRGELAPGSSGEVTSGGPVWTSLAPVPGVWWASASRFVADVQGLKMTVYVFWARGK